MNTCIYLEGFWFLFYLSLCLFCVSMYWVDYSIFAISSKIKKQVQLSLFISYGYLEFYMNFRIVLSISMKTVTEILTNCLGIMDILRMINFLINFLTLRWITFIYIFNFFKCLIIFIVELFVVLLLWINMFLNILLVMILT